MVFQFFYRQHLFSATWGIKASARLKIFVFGHQSARIEIKFSQLLECAIPPPAFPLSQKIRMISPLTVFLKHFQLDFSKAYNIISDFLTSIFPENFWIFDGRAPKGRD